MGVDSPSAMQAWSDCFMKELLDGFDVGAPGG
jgi:hypothetical protein